MEVVFFVTRRKGGKESTEVFEVLCFLEGGFTIEKLRELLERRGIERPAVF